MGILHILAAVAHLFALGVALFFAVLATAMTARDRTAVAWAPVRRRVWPDWIINGRRQP